MQTGQVGLVAASTNPFGEAGCASYVMSKGNRSCTLPMGYYYGYSFDDTPGYHCPELFEVGSTPPRHHPHPPAFHPYL